MSFGTASPALPALELAVHAYLAEPQPCADPLDIAASLIRKRTVINLLELDFASDAARFTNKYDENCFGDPSPYSWMRDNCHMTGGAAVTAVTIGDMASTLEKSVEALHDNRIGLAHLGLIAGTAEGIARSSTATSTFDEAALLAKAEASTSFKRFRIECAHARHVADREDFLAQQNQDRDWSSLRMRSLTDGGLELIGYLDAEGGDIVRTALQPLAARRAAGDDRRVEQRCADALVELCTHALDTGTIPQRASQRPHLQVTTTLETLLDLVGAPAGEIEHGGAIAAATVQRLACDATITRVLLDVNSAIVDVGHSQRVAAGATRKALNVRDKGCRWSGCERTASWTAAHHVVHWVRGGATDLSNLVLLCSHHHWLVHEGGWQIAQRDDGTIVTMPPRPLARAPDYPLVA